MQLAKEIEARYSHKKEYGKKHEPLSKRAKFELSTEDHNMIKHKVESMCQEIAGKYEVEESQMYEKLYLRVRKLFLELM